MIFYLDQVGVKMKPKENVKSDEAVSQKMDRCQTPHYAISPLVPYMEQFDIVWEPAAGNGQLVEAFRKLRLRVIPSDVLGGKNFFKFEPDVYDVNITNPPYSIKYKWLQRCYELGKPFALLMPVETIGAVKAQRLFDKYGVEIIYLSQRVNFNMPDKGYGGTAQFPTCWYTYGFNIGKQISFAIIDNKIQDKDWMSQ